MLHISFCLNVEHYDTACKKLQKEEETTRKSVLALAGMKTKMDAFIKKSNACCNEGQGRREATVVPPKNVQQEMPQDYDTDRDIDEDNV